MNRRFVIPNLIPLLIFSFVCFSWGDDFSFRKTKWGMSMQEVKNSETVKPMDGEGWDTENVLAYKIRVLKKDVLLLYIFVENKLIRAKYMLMERHTNKNSFIQDYKDFKKVLTEKYGEPMKDDVLWLNDLYKDDYSDWGTAISLGHLTHYATWETAVTEITCFLYGENYEITCGVEYSTKNSALLNIVKESEKKKKMENF